MTNIVIAANQQLEFIDQFLQNFNGDYQIILIDRGGDLLLKYPHYFNKTLAIIGDFDSFNKNNDNLQMFKNILFVKKNSIDYSDVEWAFKFYIIKNNNTKKNKNILINDGNRIDHLITNILLMNKYKFTMINKFNKLQIVCHKNNIYKNNYRYFSVYFLSKYFNYIKTNNLKYNITVNSFFLNTTKYISNEITSNKTSIFSLRKILIIQANDI